MHTKKMDGVTPKFNFSEHAAEIHESREQQVTQGRDPGEASWTGEHRTWD